MEARVVNSGPDYPVTLAGMDYVKSTWRWAPAEHEAEIARNPHLELRDQPAEGSEPQPAEEPVIHSEPVESAHGEPVESAHGEPVESAQEAELVVAEIDATDSAKALAAQHDIDLVNVTGTGAGGRITKSDVEALL
jgi:pyruvate dehydrogenase E2 component (dihydrolipoamide acetyltransferase)